jgi:hypothetical protein
VEKKRKVLILTDDDAPIQQMARDIAAIIGTYPAYQVQTVQAEDFSGIDLLPSYAFFLGCKEPGPPSFAYMEDMLGHINLAGRRCGVLSSSSGGLEYLSNLVNDSEAALGEPLLTKDGAVDPKTLQSWVGSIIDISYQSE